MPKSRGRHSVFLAVPLFKLFVLGVSCLVQGESCLFRHNQAAKASGTACRFWQNGFCKDAANCSFQHPANVVSYNIALIADCAVHTVILSIAMQLHHATNKIATTRAQLRQRNAVSRVSLQLCPVFQAWSNPVRGESVIHLDIRYVFFFVLIRTTTYYTSFTCIVEGHVHRSSGCRVQ